MGGNCAICWGAMRPPADASAAADAAGGGGGEAGREQGDPGGPGGWEGAHGHGPGVARPATGRASRSGDGRVSAEGSSGHGALYSPLVRTGTATGREGVGAGGSGGRAGAPLRAVVGSSGDLASAAHEGSGVAVGGGSRSCRSSLDVGAGPSTCSGGSGTGLGRGREAVRSASGSEGTQAGDDAPGPVQGQGPKRVRGGWLGRRRKAAAAAGGAPAGGGVPVDGQVGSVGASAAADGTSVAAAAGRGTQAGSATSDVRGRTTGETLPGAPAEAGVARGTCLADQEGQEGASGAQAEARRPALAQEQGRVTQEQQGQQEREEEEEDDEESGEGWALPCGHAYHHGCLVRWMAQCANTGAEPRCPMCQRPIELEVRWRWPWVSSRQRGGPEEGQGLLGTHGVPHRQGQVQGGGEPPHRHQHQHDRNGRNRQQHNHRPHRGQPEQQHQHQHHGGDGVDGQLRPEAAAVMAEDAAEIVAVAAEAVEAWAQQVEMQGGALGAGGEEGEVLDAEGRRRLLEAVRGIVDHRVDMGLEVVGLLPHQRELRELVHDLGQEEEGEARDRVQLELPQRPQQRVGAEGLMARLRRNRHVQERLGEGGEQGAGRAAVGAVAGRGAGERVEEDREVQGAGGGGGGGARGDAAGGVRQRARAHETRAAAAGEPAAASALASGSVGGQDPGSLLAASGRPSLDDGPLRAGSGSAGGGTGKCDGSALANLADAGLSGIAKRPHGAAGGGEGGGEGGGLGGAVGGPRSGSGYGREDPPGARPSVQAAAAAAPGQDATNGVVGVQGVGADTGSGAAEADAGAGNGAGPAVSAAAEGGPAAGGSGAVQGVASERGSGGSRSGRGRAGWLRRHLRRGGGGGGSGVGGAGGGAAGCPAGGGDESGGSSSVAGGGSMEVAPADRLGGSGPRGGQRTGDGGGGGAEGGSGGGGSGRRFWIFGRRRES